MIFERPSLKWKSDGGAETRPMSSEVSTDPVSSNVPRTLADHRAACPLTPLIGVRENLISTDELFEVLDMARLLQRPGG